MPEKRGIRPYTYIHACIHTYMHTYIHTYMHACIHTYNTIPYVEKEETNLQHTYIHTHIHTYIHTHTLHMQSHTWKKKKLSMAIERSLDKLSRFVHMYVCICTYAYVYV